MELIIYIVVSIVSGGIIGAIICAGLRDYRACGTIVEVVEDEDPLHSIEPFMVLELNKQPQWIVKRKTVTLKVRRDRDPRQ